MLHQSWEQVKSNSEEFLDLLEELGIISTLQAAWVVVRISAHTWFGLIADFRDLPRAIGINLYAAQIEINKSNERDSHADRFLPLDDEPV
jgi:hypothetical protein